MVLRREVTGRIKDVLKKHPEGLSITDLVKSVDINRNTAGRYLENLLLSGQVEMRHLGMAKMYTLANRLPVSSVLSISSELVMQLDSGQRITYANDTLLTFLGVSAKDLFGKNIEFTKFPVVFEDVFLEFLDHVRRGLKGEEWHGELPRPVQGRFFFCRVAPTVSNEGTKGVSVLLEDITDQKRDEVRIRESEARLRSIFKVSPVGIGVITNRTILEVNDRLCQMTGYSSAELIGRSSRTLYPSEEEFDHANTLYSHQIRQKGTGSVETRWVKKDGTVLDIFLSATPLDPANISGGITFTAMDVTKRNQAERALRESEDRYRSLAEASRDLIFVIGRDDRVEYVNSCAAAILGLPADQVIGQKRSVLFSGEMGERQEQGLRRVFETGKAGRSEGPMKFFGSLHWFDHFLTPIKDPDGMITSVLGVSRDITGRKQTEQALVESEEKYRYFVEQSLQGLTILENGRPVFTNSAMREISGYSSQEYLALSAEEMIATVHPDDRHRIAQVMADRLNGKNIAAEHEFRILRKDGKIRWVLTRGSLFPYHGMPAIQIAYFDITDRKQAEKALVENEERLRQITETLTSVFYVHERISNRFIYVSPAYEKIWKRSCQSLYDDPYTYLEAVHPEDKPQLLESIRKELEESRYVDTDYRILQPDGSIRWIHSRNFPIFDDQGTVYRVAGIAEDITDRKNTEQALRESEDRNRKLVEILPDAVFLHQDGRIIYANQAAVRILGASDEHDLLGKNVLDFVQPEYRDAVRTNITRDLHGEVTPSMELQMSRADGSPIIVEGRGVATTIDGKPSVLVAINEITGRNRAGLSGK